MALETSLLVNGTWTTRTVDLDSVLRHHEEKDKEAKRMNFMETQNSPEYGLLTQTIICSPLVHWILPVSLRSPGIIDIAFIGDEFVQIRELRSNGHLCDVIRREHFGARIRNARVVGSLKAYSRDAQTSNLDNIIKTEKDDDSSMKIDENSGVNQRPLTRNLPPQFILLQLETGDSIFLMLRKSDSSDLEFVVSRHSLPENSMLLLQPGTHLTIDPSSRYMAVGCSERQFAIYALHPRERLKQQYTEGDNMQMVQSQTVVSFHGIIHKMEFLFPSADDEDHIILLVLVVHKGKTRMVVYEWETGADLDRVTPHSYKGYLLAKSRETPLLLIPLTIKSAFILVCEDSMTICQGLLQGSPTCIDFNNRLDRPTPLHHGVSTPLWTSWTRPSRLPHHTASRDDLYVVREDGLVKFLEIDADADDFIRADMNIGQLGRNNGTALASVYNENLDDSTKTGDLLITGGDSCPGGTYMVRARQSPVFLQTIQNWSPSVDFTTTAISEDRNYIEPPSPKSSIPKPDRIFSCGGKGTQGAITEFRYGIEAGLGLEVDYQSPISNAWALQSVPYSQLFKDDVSLFLLSLADRSALLQLSNDASDIVEVDQELTTFDLGSRTIAASASGDGVIQVTERSIIFISEDDVQMYSGQEILGSAQSILDAIIHNHTVFYTTHAGVETHLHCVTQRASDIPAPGASQIFQILGSFSASITCVDVFIVDGLSWLMVASWDGSSVDLSLKPIDGESGWHEVRLPLPPHIYPQLEAINSIVVASGAPDDLILLCGTRNGLAVTLQLHKKSLKIRNMRWDRFGASKASITKDHYSQSPDVFFVTCDSKIYSITRNLSYDSGLNTDYLKRYWAIDQIWVTNVLDPALAQPNIDAITRLPPRFLRGSEDRTLLLVAGSQLLLAGLAPKPTAIPRHIPIRGTPSRILYSHALGGVLIVGASIERKSTLLFIDPDTGVDISRPVDKKGDPVEFVSGLGNTNERIFGLFEWPYTKEGRTWHFLIVCTSSGRLLIISFDKEATSAVRTGEGDNSGIKNTRKIRYWTRYKYKTEEPIYSVTGYPSGLCYCSGNRLYFETLDLTERKFKKISEFWLPSLARVLSHEDSNIYALTSNDSLQILKLVIPEDPEGENYQTLHTHSDKETRSALDHKLIGVEHPISLVSDKDCAVAGQWASQNTKSDTLISVFEAALPYSVLKFRVARSRPIWDHSWYLPPVPAPTIDHQAASHERTPDAEPRHMDIVPSTRMHGDVLGLSIDGSLSQFTMIGVSAWRFLRYLYNLAIKSPIVAEFIHGVWKFPLEPTTDPKIMMHVDGDILRHCLEGRKLEKLVCMRQEDEGEVEIFNTFCELLRDLHGGEMERHRDAQDYVEQAYEDLEFYLRPVL